MMRGSLAEVRRFRAMKRRWLQLEYRLDTQKRGCEEEKGEGCTRDSRVHVLVVDQIQLLCNRREDLADYILTTTVEQLNKRIAREVIGRCLQCVDHRGDACDIRENRHCADVRFSDAVEIVTDGHRELQQRCVAVARRQSNLEVGHGAEGDDRGLGDVRCAT